MQKNRRRGGSLLAVFRAKSMLKTRTYLEPNRNSLQKPIGGLFPQPLSELFKGEGVAVLSTIAETKTISRKKRGFAARSGFS
jgi:hypothetical protein